MNIILFIRVCHRLPCCLVIEEYYLLRQYSILLHLLLNIIHYLYQLNHILLLDTRNGGEQVAIFENCSISHPYQHCQYR